MRRENGQPPGFTKGNRSLLAVALDASLHYYRGQRHHPESTTPQSAGSHDVALGG